MILFIFFHVGFTLADAVENICILRILPVSSIREGSRSEKIQHLSVLAPTHALLTSAFWSFTREPAEFPQYSLQLC